MAYSRALQIAERTLLDGATLAELKQASKDLRALTPDSALADLVDAKIKLIENQQAPNLAFPELKFLETYLKG